MNETKRFTLEEYILGKYKILDNGKEISSASYGSALIICDLLNQLNDENEKLKNSFEVNITQNREDFNKDKLDIKDTNTKLNLNDGNLFIEVYIPQINDYYRFKYRVTGRNVMREFIEENNSKMTEINNCANCRHYNRVTMGDDAVFHQCWLKNDLWEKCGEYEPKKQEKLLSTMSNKELIEILKELPLDAEIQLYESISESYCGLNDVVEYDESENTIYLTGRA